MAALSDVPRLDDLMYKRILVPIEHSAYDATIIEHVRKLAHFCGASVILIHVADGFAARNLNQLDLRESEEMKLDREYLEQMCASLETTGLDAECLLAAGDPAKEISAAAARERCDLIAMSTHGHKFIKDMLYGSVANEVRHMSRVPVLLVRGQRGDQTPSSSQTQQSS
jgi:nucleotide-binding universal stress UspA family protein